MFQFGSNLQQAPPAPQQTAQFGFGQPAGQASTFGQPSAQQGGQSIFGNQPAQQQSPFGQQTFGNQAAQQQSPFSQAGAQQGAQSTFGNQATQQQSPFGQPGAQSTFGNQNAQQQSLFGQQGAQQGAQSTFGNQAAQQQSPFGQQAFGSQSQPNNPFGAQQSSQPSLGNLFSGSQNNQNAQISNGQSATPNNQPSSVIHPFSQNGPDPLPVAARKRPSKDIDFHEFIKHPHRDCTPGLVTMEYLMYVMKEIYTPESPFCEFQFFTYEKAVPAQLEAFQLPLFVDQNGQLFISPAWYYAVEKARGTGRLPNHLCGVKDMVKRFKDVNDQLKSQLNTYGDLNMKIDAIQRKLETHTKLAFQQIQQKRQNQFLRLMRIMRMIQGVRNAGFGFSEDEKAIFPLIKQLYDKLQLQDSAMGNQFANSLAQLNLFLKRKDEAAPIRDEGDVIDIMPDLIHGQDVLDNEIKAKLDVLAKLVSQLTLNCRQFNM